MEVILRCEGLTLAGPGATKRVEDAATGAAALAAVLSRAAVGASGLGGEAAETAVQGSQAVWLHRHL